MKWWNWFRARLYAQILRSSRQPGGYEAQFAGLMPPEEEQQPTRIKSSRLKENPDLATRTKDEKGNIVCGQGPRTGWMVAELKFTAAQQSSRSTQQNQEWAPTVHYSGWPYCADFEIGSLNKRIKWVPQPS